MVRQSLPSEADQVAVYREVIESYKNKPVYIRTLDIGADKPLPYLPIVEEDNPALGVARHPLYSRQSTIADNAISSRDGGGGGTG